MRAREENKGSHSYSASGFEPLRETSYLLKKTMGWCAAQWKMLLFQSKFAQYCVINTDKQLVYKKKTLLKGHTNLN